jgi:hypothetical protein
VQRGEAGKVEGRHDGGRKPGGEGRARRRHGKRTGRLPGKRDWEASREGLDTPGISDRTLTWRRKMTGRVEAVDALRVVWSGLVSPLFHRADGVDIGAGWSIINVLNWLCCYECC